MSPFLPHLAILAGKRVEAVFRIHQKTIVDFTPHRAHKTGKKGRRGLPTSRWLRQLGVLDQIVEWVKPAQKPEWMTAADYAALPASLVVRELRYQITARGRRTRTVTLVTTLLDPAAYPAEELADLYGTRWTVELNFRRLKQTMKMDVLHCKTEAGVMKELLVYYIVYNLVRQVMIETAARQQVDAERVSFIAAWRWLNDDGSPELLHHLYIVPLRPERYEPRVRKRRPKEYPVMKEPRRVLQQRPPM